MNELREQRVRTVLRVTVVVIATLGLASIVLGALPGSTADPHYLPFMTWLLAPGLVVFLHPKIGFAVAWSALAWFGTAMYVSAQGPGAAAPRTWVAEVMPYLVGPAMFLLLVVLPLTSIVHAVATRVADARDAKLAQPPLPTARIHRGI